MVSTTHCDWPIPWSRYRYPAHWLEERIVKYTKLWVSRVDLVVPLVLQHACSLPSYTEPEESSRALITLLPSTFDWFLITWQILGHVTQAARTWQLVPIVHEGAGQGTVDRTSTSSPSARINLTFVFPELGMKRRLSGSPISSSGKFLVLGQNFFVVVIFCFCLY